MNIVKRLLAYWKVTFHLKEKASYIKGNKVYLYERRTINNPWEMDITDPWNYQIGIVYKDGTTWIFANVSTWNTEKKRWENDVK